MWLTRVSIRNPVMAAMLMFALVVMGVFSYSRVPVDQFPDVEIPVVVVNTEYPGAAPESVENDVTRKIEETVNTINGVKQIHSRSYEGYSVIIIEFELTVDPAQAAQDVREKVSGIRAKLRREVKEPKISRFDPADRPVISYAITSLGDKRSLRELTTLADQVIKKRIENVHGVGAVNLIGGVMREIHVYLKPAALEAYELSADQVLNAVRSANQEVPTGALRSENQERTVQIKGKLTSIDSFNHVVVGRRGGQPVYLHQVASVVDGAEEQDSLALIDGKRTLALDVLKAQGTNTIEVINDIQRNVEELKADLPPDVQLTVAKDAALAIRASVSDVEMTMLEGAILTVLIVFLFLNSWRSTVITGLTLPISMIGTFMFIYMFGFTVNMLTLVALSLCVGLLIDDAIVVRENIVRHVDLGADHHKASLDGTDEIGMAVFATTMTIVAVFAPIGFMGGIIGRFFHQFGLTVVAAVLISMFVAFTLDPMLSSVWDDPKPEEIKRPNILDRLMLLLARPMRWFERRMEWTTHTYGSMLGWSLRHRVNTLILAIGSMVASFFLLPYVGTEMLPNADFAETLVNFTTPEGSSLELTETKAKQVDAALREFPDVEYTYTAINTGNANGKNSAALYVKLTPRKQRTRSQAELTQPIRERLQQIAGITVTHVGTVNPVMQGKQLVFSLQGPDMQVLTRLAADARKRLDEIPGIVDLDTSLKPSKPTVGLDIRRDVAADLGIDVTQLGMALRPFLAGEEAGSWLAPDNQNYDIKVRLAPEDRVSPADLERIMLQTARVNPDGSPKMVPLSQVARISSSTGVQQINRRDLTREVEFNANAHGRSVGEISSEIKAALDKLDWPPGYRYKIGGSTRDMEEAFHYSSQALMLAILFIYMILAAQFNSFIQPLSIMASLPLTLIGVVLSLLIFGSTLNVFSIIGFILLMGLVTKNAILLIDFAIRARAEGMPREAALIEAARVRFRPIIMTSMAMVFGMLPLAFGSTSEGAELRMPMGQTVMGGVITSSILTLVVVPVIYTYLDDLEAWLKRILSKPQ
ncbi:Nodulation protein NolG [Sterolibacterium denitrificans]|uniref:Nodulation protein NolG n=1 Tax=Sterolibacterium denitrificans TaxID=157592 RepID=A0A7Z7MV99_9PROT|nr:efflux RND transporter permease subunit [Sterolibacterium denitrificans]SMB26143.1 Nodulation protein NolG [Sterolibacterium denitrificans]